MTIRHHPSEAVLATFSAGTLDHGQHIAVATHLVACNECRRLAHSFDHVGGAVLENLPPVVMAADAFSRMEARLSEPPRATATPPIRIPENELPGLPQFLRTYRFGDWKWIAPSTYIRPVELPHASDTRVFLLKGGPGTKLLRHSHTGVEMTCILTGGYSQYGEHYGVGDFDLGDDTVEHDPTVDPGEECICLVAMQGGLRLRGLLGKAMQPFVRL
jgi:putative transcriptional regulator